MQQLETLATGAFLETATNVLAFGLPGVGKSHALCAVGHALVEAGHSVLCAPAYALVQERLGAKRDLDLPRALRKLDLFEVILLDDLGYVQQSPDEAEALFTLRRALRAPLGDGDQQPGLQPVGADLPRPDGDGRGDRPPGAPRRRARVRSDELPHGPVAAEIAAGTCTPRPAVDLVNAGSVRDPHNLWMVPAAWKTRGGRASTRSRRRVFHTAVDGRASPHPGPGRVPNGTADRGAEPGP